MRIRGYQAVIVSKAGRVYYGTERFNAATDEPPVIEANGKRWYRHVWIEQGWTVENDEQ